MYKVVVGLAAIKAGLAVSVGNGVPGEAVVVLPNHKAVCVSPVAVAVVPHPVLTEGVAIHYCIQTGGR